MSDPSREPVALYGPDGRVVGAAPRAVVRRDNLHHAATSVVVRDPAGRVYVHRRTQTKDVYPGLLDFCAGGVVQAGEDPDVSAARELQEELGVSAAPEPRGSAVYEDAVTSYRAFRYVVTWDGPVRWQPEEVAWGEWVDAPALVEQVAREPGAFTPDSVALWAAELVSWASGEPD